LESQTNHPLVLAIEARMVLMAFQPFETTVRSDIFGYDFVGRLACEEKSGRA
jgi:hypothetical protein